MGASQVAVTESYLSHLEGKLGGEQLCFTTFPVLGMCTTYSSSSVITDSAASGTAIASGHKTNNGMLGADAEGNPVQSVAQILKDEMQNAADLSVSLEVDLHTGKNWYEAK